jgi:aminopeptidase N
LSQPFSAYEWWPCKQSLTDKADSCSVKITVPNACKAGSNGLLENVVDLGNGTSRYEWKNTHLIDYYLISVAVAHYVEYNVYANPVGSPAPVLIQNYIYDNPATLPNFQADINETADFMELFATLVGPYPFDDQKYGHCMAPLSGGMEHQTMTTQGFFEKSLTAHELGHMWFGDHVTCATWADIWVNEGFASYLDYLMIENLYPAEKVQYMLDVHTNVMSSLGGSVWVLDSLNETRIFSGRLTYDKGSSIIHTMRFMVNNDTQFFQALRNYQTMFADSVAKGLDVKAALETVSGIDFTNMFNEWYFGEGYPTYSTRRHAVGNNLNFEITHTASKPSVTPTFTNPIEIKFSRTSQADTTIRFDITGNSTQYFLPNIGAVTNIVAIDPNNWVINQVGTNVNDANFYTEISEFSSSDFITIYPNPTTGTVQVNLPNEMSNCSLKITDLNGKILKKSIISNSTKISLEEYHAGTYLFVFELNDTLIKIEKVQKN